MTIQFLTNFHTKKKIALQIQFCLMMWIWKYLEEIASVQLYVGESRTFLSNATTLAW
jgi:hypothetical protein